MVKFQCTQCGGRLAVQEKHLDRLAKCPECGQITHPMAGQILAQRSERLTKLECDNCARPLGRLERPRQWANAVVCRACYRELALDQMERDQAEAQQADCLEPMPRVVLITTANPTSSKTTIRTLPLPRLPQLSAAVTQRIFPGTSGFDLRPVWKVAAICLLIGATATMSATYLLHVIGPVFLTLIITALVGAMIRSMWRWSVAHPSWRSWASDLSRMVRAYGIRVVGTKRKNPPI